MLQMLAEETGETQSPIEHVGLQRCERSFCDGDLVMARESRFDVCSVLLGHPGLHLFRGP